MRRRTLALGALAAAAGVGAGWWARRSRADAAPERLWTERFARPDGGELAMADWRGRPLVLNFWATWCAPCVRELPALDRFHREQGERGWRVVALAIDAPAQVREFLAKVPVTMPVGLAAAEGAALARELGNTHGGLPFTVLVGADGAVLWRKLGETTFEELRRAAA